MAEWLCSLREFAARWLAILSSYKMAILLVVAFLTWKGCVDGIYLFLVAVLVISARAFQDALKVWKP